MCGLAGILLNHAARGAELEGWVSAAGRMEAILAHRGPDDSGVHASSDGRCVLASRRLAIQDLSPDGRMPLANEDGTVWVSFNGEIYNFRVLREELIALGHVFRSGSDTEVLVHGYESWGDGLLGRLEGMFAIALYDERRGQLLLARDRFGEKPLYYTWTAGGHLLFASEAKALFEAGAAPPKADAAALCQYLTYGFVMPPLTLFHGVGKLGPGEMVRIGTDMVAERTRFWLPGPSGADAAEIRSRDWEGHVAAVRGMLSDSVEARMVADVPVGAFLSGGVDSSAVVSLMSRLSGRPVETVTVSTPGHPEMDEWSHASAVAKAVGANARRVEISETDAIAALPDIAWHLDEPISDPAALNTYFASKSLRASGVVVALVGEGADELFLGYGNYLRYGSLARRMAFAGRLPAPVLRAGGALGRVALSAMGADVHLGMVRRASRGEPIFIGTETFFDDPEKPALVGPDVAAASHSAAVAAAAQALAPAYMASDPLSVFSVGEVRMRMAEKLLMRVDKMSSAHSLEVRSPFLDTALANYALALPSDIRAAGGVSKALLKDAVAPFVPADIIARRKQGFSTPLQAWLRDGLGRHLERRVAEGRIFRDGILAREPVLALLAAHRAGGAPARTTHTRLWNVISLAEWYERHAVQGISAAPSRIGLGDGGARGVTDVAA